jgi:hypothetical protein
MILLCLMLMSHDFIVFDVNVTWLPNTEVKRLLNFKLWKPLWYDLLNVIVNRKLKVDACYLWPFFPYIFCGRWKWICILLKNIWALGKGIKGSLWWAFSCLFICGECILKFVYQQYTGMYIVVFFQCQKGQNNWQVLLKRTETIIVLIIFKVVLFSIHDYSVAISNARLRPL